MESGTRLDSIGEASTTQIRDRLTDILETHIVVGNVESGEKYYRTKDGGTIFVENAGKPNMTVAGGWQVEHGEKLPVAQIYKEETVRLIYWRARLYRPPRNLFPIY